MSLPDPIREIPVTSTFIPIVFADYTIPVLGYSCSKKKCCKRYKKGKKRCKKCPEKN